MDTSAWLTVKLAELCDSIDYGYTASASSNPVGPKFLRITDIVDGYIDWNTVPFCDIEPTLEEKYRLHHGDIVIARTGAPTGVSTYISKPPRAIFASYLVRLKMGCRSDSRFVSYFLQAPSFWGYIRGVLGDKSAQPNASARTMTQASILLPPLPEQRAIAHILGTLDDKIELNRRMNQTLEAMAQALFKSWFVDFEPFLNQGMQDLPLGEIPVGWDVVIVDELGEIVCGKTPPTADKENYGGNIPFITIPDMHENVFVTSTATYLTEKGAATQPKKLLPKLSVCVSCIATPGLVSITTVPSHTNQQINSIICDSTISPYWCYLAMTGIRQEIITGGAGGSATLNLNKGAFSKLQVLKPDNETMKRFHNYIEPVFSRILSNDLENITLAATRDILLPKLLSGEIRIRDAEKFVEKAA